MGINMKKRLVLPLILMFVTFLTIESSAQVVGDYRTQAGGNWTALTIWQRLNSIGPEVWAQPTAGQGYPGQNAVPGTVTIRNTHNVFLNISPVNSIGNLVLGGGTTGTLTVGIAANSNFTLTCTGAVTIGAGALLLSRVDDDGTHTFNFQSTLTNNGTINFAAGTEQVTMTVSGTTTNNGIMTFGTNTGVKTFIGSVSNTGTWTSTVLATAANLVFRGGVSSTAGTFAAGGATFNTTAAQSIGGTAAMSFADVVVTGVTVTNTNTNTVTITTTLTGTGTFAQGTTTNTLAFGGTVIGIIGGFNAAGASNIVNYTGASPAIFPTTYNTLYVNGSGTATVGGTTTVNWTMDISSAITNNSTLTVTTSLVGIGTLTQGATGILNIGDLCTITTFVATTAGNTVNYTEAGSQIIRSTTSNTYYNLGLSGSGTKSFGVATTISGNLSITGTAIANLGAATHTANTLSLASVRSAFRFVWKHWFAQRPTEMILTFGNTSNRECEPFALQRHPAHQLPTTPGMQRSGGNWNDNNSWTTSSDGYGWSFGSRACGPEGMIMLLSEAAIRSQ
jgi:hypothetical protein